MVTREGELSAEAVADTRPVERPEEPRGQVLRSALQPPLLREDSVPRTSALQRLPAVPKHMCTIIQAPAGYGKTTLAVQWLAHDEDRPVAWFTVNEYYTDPVRFWMAVTEAIATVAPGFGAGFRAILSQAGARILDVLPRFVNELLDLGRPVILVLDDLHLVTDPDVLETLSWLIDQMPDNLRLVITTRTTPSLHLGRLRAAGQLLEIDESGLRFDQAEGASLLGAICPGLDDEIIATAIEKTEGWPVGLVLLGTTICGQPDPGAFLESFDGRDRDIEQYLVEEVLDRSQADDREWMLTTSVLAELTGDACDEVTGRNDSGARLARLGAANSFIVPLDRQGISYRYHQLFADCLQKRLRTLRPDRSREAHRRACGWCHAHGQADEAFGHAVASGDLELAGRVATENAYGLMSVGRTKTLRHQLQRLGDDALVGHPDLALAGAIAAALEGAESAPQEIPRLLTMADAAAELSELGETRIRTQIEVAGAIFTFVGAERSRQASLRILARGGEDADQPMVSLLGAMSHYYSGRLSEAASFGERTIDRLQSGDGVVSSLEELAACAMLAFVATDQQELDRARYWAERAMTVMVENHLDETRPAAHAPLALGRLHLRMGELDSAEPLLQQGLRLAPTWSLLRILALLELARLAIDRGDLPRAEELLDEAGSRIEAHEDAGKFGAEYRRLCARGRATSGGQEHAAKLSQREQEVLELLPTALTTRQIAERLYISINTAKSHIRSVYRKLGASSRDEAVAIAAGRRDEA